MSSRDVYTTQFGSVQACREANATIYGDFSSSKRRGEELLSIQDPAVGDGERQYVPVIAKVHLWLLWLVFAENLHSLFHRDQSSISVLARE